MNPVSPVSGQQMLDIAIEVNKLTPYEQDMLVRFTHFAVEKDVFQQDHPLTNIKGRKACGWSMLDVLVIKLILEALVDPLYHKFSLESFHKFAAKMKAADAKMKKKKPARYPVTMKDNDGKGGGEGAPTVDGTELPEAPSAS